MKIARVSFTTSDGSWIKAGTVIGDDVDLTGCHDLVDTLDVSFVDNPDDIKPDNPDDIKPDNSDGNDAVSTISDVTENKMVSDKIIKSKNKSKNQ